MSRSWSRSEVAMASVENLMFWRRSDWGGREESSIVGGEGGTDKWAVQSKNRQLKVDGSRHSRLRMP